MAFAFILWDTWLCHQRGLAQLKPYSTAQIGIFGLGLMNEKLSSEYGKFNIVF